MNRRTLAALAALTLLTALPATAQVRCGDVITTSRALTGDLDCRSGWTGIEIAAPNVTLDLNGHTLSGSIFQGVSIRADRVTLRGPGVIKGYELGAQIYDAADVTIEDVMFSDLGRGVHATGADRLQLRDNAFAHIPGVAAAIVGFDNGSTVLPSRNGVAFGNRFYEVDTGLRLCGTNATGHRLEKNQFVQTRDYGIHLETGTSGNTLYRNTMERSLTTGIRISNASGNRLIQNYLDGGRIGVALHDNDGFISSNCAAPVMPAVVTGNLLDSNYIGGFEVAIALGLGIDAMPRVIANRIELSKLYDNGVGIGFREDAWRNTSTRNAFSGTATPILDDGTANVH